jgi:lipopolysaccharide export system permease protein
MLKKLDKVVVQSYILPLVVTYLLTTFIFVMQFLWKYIDDIVGKGLELYLIFKLVALFAIIILPMALPLAILLASTMVMGNLAESNELTAYKSCGISLLRVMRGLIFSAILMSAFAFYFSNRISPYVNLKFYALLYDIRKQKPALDIKEGIFYRGITHFAIKIKKKDSDNKTLYDIIVYDHTATGNDLIVTAKKGEILLSNTGQYLILNLYDGNQYQFQPKMNTKEPDVKEMTVMTFKKWRKIFDLKEFKMQRTDESLFKSNYVMYNVKQLQILRDSVRRDINETESRLSVQIKETFVPASKTFSYSKTNDTLQLKPVAMDSIFARKLDAHGATLALERANSMISNVNSTIDNLKWKYSDENQYLIEFYRKFSLSFACIVLMLIGAVMGAIVRKGGFGFPVLIAVLYFVAFHFCNVIGEKLAESGVLPVVVGMWLAAIVLFPVAIFLLYKALNDSVIFRTEGLQQVFGFVKNKIKREK